MKTLAAWSTDRRRDGVHHGPGSKSQQQALQEECAAEIEALSNTLLDTLSLYRVIELQTRGGTSLGNWVKSQSAIVKSGVDAQLDSIRKSLVSVMADAVGPIIQNAIESKAIDDFCSTLEQRFESSIDENTVIRVSERMHRAFVEQLRERGLKIRVEPHASPEIELHLADTIIETKVASTVEQLERMFTP